MNEGPIHGWEPGLEEDTLLRAYTEAMAERVAGSGVLTDTFAANDSGFDSWVANESVPRSLPTKETFEAIRSWYPDGRKFGCFVSFLVTDTPDGFEMGGHPPFMVRAAGGTAPRTSLTSRRLTGDAEHIRASEILSEAFGVELPDGHSFFPPSIEHSNFALYGLFDGEELVATASAYPAHGVNLIEMVAVPPHLHRRGYGEAATWAATMHAPDLPSVLIASDAGRPVYERMGYLKVCRLTFLMGTGAGQQA